MDDVHIGERSVSSAVVDTAESDLAVGVVEAVRGGKRDANLVRPNKILRESVIGNRRDAFRRVR